MTIGIKIQTLRKQRGMSQEQLAEALGVSRQAVSKWESEQSVPDIDKIIAICDFFGVTTDYILRDAELTQSQPEATEVYTYNNINETEKEDTEKRKKSALLLAIAIMLYILCVIPVFLFENALGVVLMFVMVAVATGIIVYRAIINSKEKKEEKEPPKNENPVLKAVKSGVWTIATVVYFAISFASGAWHITWLVFPITGAIVNVIEACFDLKGSDEE